MFENEKEMRRKLGQNVEGMKAILNKAESEKRDLTNDEKAQFDTFDKEVTDLRRKLRINVAERTNNLSQYVTDLDTELSKPINPFKPADFGGIPDGEVWRDNQDHELRVYRPNEKLSQGHSLGEYEGLTVGGFLRAMILGPKTDAEKRALSFGTDSAGGFTVPSALMPGFIDLMRAKSHVIRAGARTVDLSTGKTTTIARLASDVTVGWRAENAEITAADVTFEGVTFAPKSLGALIKVSRELSEDSVNLGEILQTSFAGAFAGELDRVALMGTGTAPEPRGIKNITNVNSYSMGTNGLALTNYEPFLQAINLIDLDNGPEPTAAIYAPRTDIAVNLLKDTTNQPLQRPHRIANLPFYITSKIPINETQGTSNNASRIYLGDFTQLMLGVRQVLRIEVLKERYAEFVQYGFVGTLRADIAVTHPEAFAMVVGIIP